jgi:hypothetical protein
MTNKKYYLQFYPHMPQQMEITFEPEEGVPVLKHTPTVRERMLQGFMTRRFQVEVTEEENERNENETR